MPRVFVNDTGMNISLNETTLQHLEKLTKPVHVIGIAGMYRSGKSFIAKKLSDCDFTVGHTRDTFTRGVEMAVTEHQGSYVLWFDTEGLFSGEAELAKYGDKLFTFSLLTSSIMLLVSGESISSEIVHYFKVLNQTKNFKMSDPKPATLSLKP